MFATSSSPAATQPSPIESRIFELRDLHEQLSTIRDQLFHLDHRIFGSSSDIADGRVPTTTSPRLDGSGLVTELAFAIEDLRQISKDIDRVTNHLCSSI